MKKRVITLTILIVLILFSSYNCLSLVYPDKTGVNSNKITKISKWNGQDSNFPNNFESGGQLEISYEYKQNSEDFGLGLIGIINLCIIIPCIDKYTSELIITYKSNNLNISSEVIKGTSFVIKSLIPLIPYAIFFPNDDNENIKIKFIDKVIPYIQNNMSEVEKKLFEIEKNRELAYKEFIQLPDTKCKPLYQLRGKNFEIFTKQQQDETWNKFQSCVEKKLMFAISKKYPFLKKHLKKEILFEDSPSSYELLDLFNTKYLSVIPNTGRKLKDSEFYITKINDRSFSLTMQTNKDIVKVDFEIKNDKLYCISIEAGFQRNPNNWEYFAQLLFKSLYSYPVDEHWDWEFLDNN